MNRLKIFAIAAALGAAITGSAFVASTTDAVAQATQLLFETRSENGQITDTFDANGVFEVRWTATGGQFKVAILDPANDDEIISGPPMAREDDQGPMTGKITHTGPGTFKLGVEATGPWHIRVVEIQ